MDNPHYDVIVVGGGAAGLLAAGQAAQQGARTLLLEKKNRPGRKLLLTGNGRCNLTNTNPLPDFLDHFRHNGPFLRQAFSEFFAGDLVRFLHTSGVATITEPGGRIFPASGSAQEILDSLLRWNTACGVTIQNHAPVERLLVEDGHIAGVQVASVSVAGTRAGPACDYPRRTYTARAVILTTGGASYPGTGSSGDGYRLAEAVGHTIVPVRPALVPLETAGDAAQALQGLSLQEVAVSVWFKGKKRAAITGEMLFTHFGVSGPAVLSLSGQAVDALLGDHRVTLSIDLFPSLDEDELDHRLLRSIDAHGRQQLGTLLKDLLPRRMIPLCTDSTGIPIHRVGHQLTSQERARLRAWLKDVRFEITGHRSFKEAIITAGGVNTREVDPNTMQSRRVTGLYFAGEVLDVDADTGGYNLQAAFSTGWLAGRSAAAL